ncbi:MAG TPA: response regulator transcription factor [Gemmatimonadaceae bacterium]|nr:response regulator transcription factor [Gemmatimonadaceae bacterium]
MTSPSEPSEFRPIRVLLADDHALVREGIRHVLSDAPGFEVVGEAARGADALALAQELVPDVIVLDISMPGGSGLDITPRLRELVPGARVLILSIHDHEEYVLQSVRSGAHGYLRKDSSPTELREAIRAVHQGSTFFSAPVARQLGAALRGEGTTSTLANKLALLTAREREVLGGIASGATNKDMAARFGISTRTVESHRESLMRKLDIRTVAGLTRFAVESGLLPG